MKSLFGCIIYKKGGNMKPTGVENPLLWHSIKPGKPKEAEFIASK
jgi:hypothetical protein